GFCKKDTDSAPVITGTTGGTFTTTSSGLVLDASTGVVDLSLSAVGMHTVTYTRPGIDCQNSSDVSIQIHEVYNEVATATICDGNTYIFGTQSLTIGGQYTEVFQSAAGCDSTVELTLTVNSVINAFAADTICEGESYVFGTQTLTIGGVYNETFQPSVGCDSIVELTLTVNRIYNATEIDTICEGESYTFGTQTLTTGGVFTEIFQSVLGCDSIVELTLTVNPIYNTTVFDTI